MELPDTLLRPIAGPNPSGQNLRYDPVYEKVKEARREEDDLPQGAWSRSVKTADSALVIRLTIDALTNKSKDLQLAAWLTEALLRQDGIGGLKKGLDLIFQLNENFWDTLYPLPEDGDAELRAAPLNWIASYIGQQIKKTPLTESEFDWLGYTESRAVGYEKDCEGNDAKTAARQAAIEDKKLTPEEFDGDMNATAASFYVELVQDIDGALASLQQLDEQCSSKLGNDSPSFVRLQETLEDVRSLAKSFLESKGYTGESAEAEERPQEEVVEQEAPGVALPVAAKAPARKAISEAPADRDDAIHRILAAVRYLRKAEPYSPAPYMILRGLRWGELRAAAAYGLGELEAPPSEVRQSLKRLAVDGQWSELIDAAEDAMALPCGKAWLDLQRYLARACQERGSDYASVEAAIRTGVSALVMDIPDLMSAVFVDDTPVANAETLAWLDEITGAAARRAESEAEAQRAEEPEAVPDPMPATTLTQSADAAPDVEVVATQLARAGRVQEALEMLSREISQVRTGRARFERKTQLASLCLITGHEAIAYPILKDLALEIEMRKLDEWESPSMLANSLSLLFRCLEKTGADPGEKEAIYQQICRLDPVRALVTLKR